MSCLKCRRTTSWDIWVYSVSFFVIFFCVYICEQSAVNAPKSMLLTCKTLKHSAHIFNEFTLRVNGMERWSCVKSWEIKRAKIYKAISGINKFQFINSVWVLILTHFKLFLKKQMLALQKLWKIQRLSPKSMLQNTLPCHMLC